MNNFFETRSKILVLTIGFAFLIGAGLFLYKAFADYGVLERKVNLAGTDSKKAPEDTDSIYPLRRKVSWFSTLLQSEHFFMCRTMIYAGIALQASSFQFSSPLMNGKVADSCTNTVYVKR